MNNSDLDATHYIQHSTLQNDLATSILNSLSVPAEARILDVGCGDGRITAELAKRAITGHVDGVDISPSMIQSASDRFAEFPNLHFKLSSIEDADFPESFDLITSFSCFHWLKEPQKILQKLASRLVRGGELLILTYPKESPYYRYLETALEKYPEYKHLSANTTMLSAQEYRDFFEENHFSILQFDEKTIFAEYRNQEEIFGFIKGWVNNYVLLPSEQQEPFINDVVQAILDDPTTKCDSLIKVPYTALIMKIQK